ncbi:threonine--tRNA ligase [bacterium]|nr:threonine--tRNA ligase [bacterium]
MNSNELNNLRHSTAHLLAAAISELYPTSKNTIGPAIENKFYYDFDFGEIKITENDFPKIEQKMHEIVQNWNSFEKHDVSAKDALLEFSNNEYKCELIKEFESQNQDITIYQSGDFRDLCKGGHIENPSKEIKNFKLLSVAGAYWRGNEKNKMLTRIYGTAFFTQEDLENYLNMLLEAEKRNHRKLGKELELFMFHETAPGMAYFLPKGVKIYNELVDYWRTEHEKYNYQEIFSPLLNKKELYEISGHWDHYRENMFLTQTEESETYALKPMNCPNAMVIYGTKTRSYKELPLKLGDTDALHRFEMSGTLNGLLRTREFRQDDAHIFITEDQIKDSFKELFEITEKFYSVFGLNYTFRLGTRPESFMGDENLWDKAEKNLKEILEESKKDFFILEGDGAFYGPKIDILMKDSLGREWQMGTIQLDFQLPRRFNLKYTDKDGAEKTPVVIHRVIYGSFERFIGIITEHFGGNFPVWLSPVQAKIIPISDKFEDYTNEVFQKLKDSKIRVEIDNRNETLGSKIRDAQNEKIPYMLIIGQKEVSDQNITVRKNNSKDMETFSVTEFLEFITKTINTKSLKK